MVLYIEYVIIDNFLIDYILLKLLSFTFKDSLKKKNIIISCILGTISAVCLPMLMRYKTLLIIYKILTAFIMVLVLKKYRSYGQYFLHLIVLFVYTFLFGGVAIAIFNIFDIPYTVNGLLLYNCEFPVSIFILIFGSGSFLFKKIILSLGQQMKLNNCLYKIKLMDNGKLIECMGFYDSGNTVSRDGNAVNIISIDTFFRLHSDYSMEKLLFRNMDESILKNPRYIDVVSISNSTKYLSFTIDKMIINNDVYENAVLAVAMKNFQNFDCIINSDLIGGVK